MNINGSLHVNGYGVGMSYTAGIRNYLVNVPEWAGTKQIISSVRSDYGGTYREVQRDLYAMVKAGLVEWNREMGNRGRYRLVPGATASPPPPLSGGSDAGTGDDGLAGAEDDVEPEPDDDYMVRWVRRYKSGKEPYNGFEVAWLVERGYAKIIVTPEGRTWVDEWSN